LLCLVGQGGVGGDHESSCYWVRVPVVSGEMLS
jgi:hypothetical protein